MDPNMSSFFSVKCIDWSESYTGINSIQCIDWFESYTVINSIQCIDWSESYTVINSIQCIDWSESYTVINNIQCIDLNCHYTWTVANKSKRALLISSQLNVVTLPVAWRYLCCVMKKKKKKVSLGTKSSQPCNSISLTMVSVHSG